MRWLRTPAGVTIRLPARRFGTRWYTTAKLAAEFVAAATTDEPSAPRTLAARERASRDAEAQLRRLGM